MSKARVWASGVFMSVLLVSASAFAQQQASVTGTVTDESKAILPGVTVTATNLETGGTSVAVTDEKGEFRLLRLPPG